MKRTFGMMIVAAVALAAVIGVLPLQGHAAMTFYGKDDRKFFVANDFVDWGTFGPGSDVEIVPNGSSTTSNNYGVAVTVANPDGDFFLRYDNSFVNSNFGGSDVLFTSVSGVGPLEITFDRPVFTAGAQIAANNNVLPYVARIEAFNGSGASLGFFEQEGDNFNVTAPVNFMGVFDP